MPLEITYWTRSKLNENIPGSEVLSEQRTISGTSAQSGATPGNADYVSVTATEAARIKYNSANPTASSTGASLYMSAGERVWLDAQAGFKIAGITP